jgi:hypothetical protein
MKPLRTPSSAPRRNAVAVTAALIASVILVGCGGPQSPRPEEPGTETPTQEPSEGTPDPGPAPLNEDLACMLGQWDLDLEDYAAQALEYLSSLSIPIESLTISGTESVSITEESFSIAWGVQNDAVVHGIPISVTSEAAGLGDWFPNTDGENRFMVSNWSYTVEPVTSDSSLPIPPLFDPAGNAPITAGCFGDALTLHADGAPLSGHFVRRH